MSVTKTLTEQDPVTLPDLELNDFSITVATVNGSGSQTSNLTLLRSLFKMGIPVSGKNLFPSDVEALERDGGSYLGFVRLVAERSDAEAMNLYDPGLGAIVGVDT